MNEYTRHRSHSNPWSLSPQERIVKTLVDKMITKVPSYSGLSLSELETDESLLQVQEALCQLSRHSANTIVWSLCENLDKLQKKHIGPETSLHILESELYLTRVLIRVLDFRANIYTPEENASDLEGIQNTRSSMPSHMPPKPPDSTLIEPPALEENVAKNCIITMLSFISRSGPTNTDVFDATENFDETKGLHDPDPFEGERISTRLPIRLYFGFGIYKGRFHASRASARTPSDRQSISSFASDGSTPSLASYIPSASFISPPSLFKESSDLISHMAGRVISHLSACNWSPVFSRIKEKMHYLTANMTDEGQDIIDLRLATYSLINKNRLTSLLQELSPLLVKMRPAAQCAASVMLRTVVWNWIEDFTEEFIDVVKSSRKQLDGQPERAFDLLYQLTGPKNNGILWPTLSVLLVASPERINISQAPMAGNPSFRKHYGFLGQLHHALTTQSKLGEVAMMCYNDICRAAFHLPPPSNDNVLYSLAPELAEELKNRLMNAPSPTRAFYDSLEPIEVDLYANSLVTILRYHPLMALVDILPVCLEPDRSAAVKLCVVKALTIFITEAPKFPWQFAPDKALYSLAAPKLRAMAMGLHTHTGGHSSLRPLSARDGSPAQPKDDRKELVLSLHVLWRVDLGFLFMDMKEEEYIPLIEAILEVLQPPKDESIRTSTFRTLAVILSKLNNPQDDHSDHVQEFMHHAGAIFLRSGGQALLRVTENLEENESCINMIISILSQLVDQSLKSRQMWKFDDKFDTALAVVQAALLVCLVSPRSAICSLAARGLALMAALQGPHPERPVHEHAFFRDLIFSKIGDPRIVALSRVEFQRSMRNTIRSAAYPCTTLLVAWKECYYRWLILKPIVTANATLSSTDASEGSSLGIPTPEERQMEWENLTLFLASAGASCLSDDQALNPSPEYGIPFREGITDQKPSFLIKRFTGDLVDLLATPWVPARSIGKQALGNELASAMLPVLFEHLDEIIRDSFRSDSDFSETRKQSIVFVDQVISVFGLIMDRSGEQLIEDDVGDNILSLGRFIHRRQRTASELIIKTRFCVLIDNILERHGTLKISEDIMVRNNLLDVIAEWILEYPTQGWPDNDLKRTELLQTQCDSNLAALKTCVNLLENLRLQASSGSNCFDMPHAASRLFHRYCTIFITALTPWHNESKSLIDFDQPPTNFSTTDEKSIQDLVVRAIAHMLQANTEEGIKHVLCLGYRDSPRLFSVFAHVFCRVLSRGMVFNQEVKGGYHGGHEHSLCKLTRESEILAPAIIDACPTSEVDTIVPVLLNIYNTRRTLLDLLRGIIHRHVQITKRDTELFRTNDTCNRLLSAFAKYHGYYYLRSIIAHLITLMLELPVGRGYELDLAKIRPGETQEGNVENIKMITTAFLTVLADSVGAMPPIIREVCRYIADATAGDWPQSHHAVVGSFIFRIIVPAVVAPKTVDIEIPQNDPRAASMSRGLILVAKTIQSLANNTMFNKGAHGDMTRLNPFLQNHAALVSRFYNDVLNVTTEPNPQNVEEWLGTSCDETDDIILHRFFLKHADKIGKILLSGTEKNDSDMSNRAKQTWDSVSVLLMEMGDAMEPPVQSDQASSQHQVFRTLMAKNGHRNMNSVRQIFQITTTLRDQRPLFILALAKIDVETVDLELLMSHIFKTIMAGTGLFEQPFDVIIDCTAFTGASEFSISWCKLCMEHIPSDLRRNFETAYILNSDATTQKLLRKLYHVCSGAKLANHVIALSSSAELVKHVHTISLSPMSDTMTAESESYTYFECHQQQLNQLRTPMLIQIGVSHVRITSLKAQPIYPGLSCNTVEIIRFLDIANVVLSDTTDFAIQRINGNTASFSSPDRDEIAKVIRIAVGRSRFRAVKPLNFVEPSGRVEDVSAALHRVAMFNLCDENESSRAAAYKLLCAVCPYVHSEASSIVLSTELRPSMPPNTVAFIVPLSGRLANSAPHLTLDLILDFAIGFERASTVHKIRCLQCLSPWIKNLADFANPTSSIHKATEGKLRDSIRELLEILVKYPDVYSTLQKSLWAELRTHNILLDMALEELVRLAVDGGLGRRDYDQIADTFIDMSSINVRARVLMKVQQQFVAASAKTTRPVSQHENWDEMSAYARLAYISVYSSQQAAVATPSHLFAAEIAHLTTMLCATGTLPVKTAIYGMAVSLIQSLHTARAHEEGPALDLQMLLEHASSPDVLLQFGLIRTHGSSDDSAVEPAPDQISIEALEGITKLIIEGLAYGAQDDVLSNLWKDRWMSLVTASAFQSTSYIQHRAFTVLGTLASSDPSKVDNSLLKRMLVAFKNSLETMAENDSLPATSMLRCIAKTIPGIALASTYLSQVFWLAVALLQSTYLSLYEEAAQLLRVTLEAMSNKGFFKNRRMSTVLLEARLPLSSAAMQLDGIVGLSFDISFSFSLAFVIFHDIPSPALRPVARALLNSVFRVAAESSRERVGLDSNSPAAPLDHDIVGYFLALLPFASTSATYRELLKEARVDTRWWPPVLTKEDGDEDDAVPRVDMELFGFSATDNRTPFLVVSFIFAILHSHQEIEQDNECLFGFLSQLALIYPDLCASVVAHYVINPRSEWLLRNLTEPSVESPETALAVQNLFHLTMASPAWMSAVSSTIGAKGDDASLGTRTPHYKALEGLNMQALAGTSQSVPKDEASRMLHYIMQLLDTITLD